MILKKATQTNINFLFDIVKNKFEVGEDYNDLEPKSHVINILNKISIYFHITNLSQIEIFYLTHFLGIKLNLQPDFVNSKVDKIKISQFDMSSAFSELNDGKKFKTVIHLTGSSLMMLINGKPFDLFNNYFKAMKIEKVFDENHNANINEHEFLEYLFKLFYFKYSKFVNNFIIESDLLVDSSIYSTFYSKLQKYNTDVVLHFIDSKNHDLIDDESHFVFGINSSLISFLTLYNFYLKSDNILDFKDFKIIEPRLLTWMETILKSSQNQNYIYSKMKNASSKFISAKNNKAETLNRYSYFVGGYPISYTLKLTKPEFIELFEKIKNTDDELIENSEIKIIMSKIFDYFKKS